MDRPHDTLIVWRLDRLGRNLADLVRLIAELEQRKVNFESRTEKIETNSPTGRLVFQVFAALAEFERNLIRERTVAGLTAARARGRKGGPPPKLSANEVVTVPKPKPAIGFCSLWGTWFSGSIWDATAKQVRVRRQSTLWN